MLLPICAKQEPRVSKIHFQEYKHFEPENWNTLRQGLGREDRFNFPLKQIKMDLREFTLDLGHLIHLRADTWIEMFQKHSERATAFPILISIAALCVLEPRSRALGSQSRYKTFIRASPFVCLLDSLNILLRWLLTSIYLRCPPLIALKIVGHDRFRGSEPLAGVDKIRANPFLRLVYLILVALPGLWKLFSFKFTPMAQIYAGIFIFSYVVDETVTFFTPPKDYFSLPRKKFTSLASYSFCLTHQDESRVAKFRGTLLSLDILTFFLSALIVIAQVIFFIYISYAYCIWDMDYTGDVIRLCANKAPLYGVCILYLFLAMPLTNRVLLIYPSIGRALHLVYPKIGRPEELEVDSEAVLWFCFLMVNLLSVGIGYRVLMVKVPYG